MDKTIGIHQPNYFPWLGYFAKINAVNLFVILDDVDFQTGNASSITNRCKIKTHQGEQWLTVPVLKGDSKRINTIGIDNKQAWQNKQLKTIQLAYSKAPYFKTIYAWLEERFSQQPVLLSEWNTYLIEEVAALLAIDTPFLKSSKLLLEHSDKNERIIDICKLTGATCYLSGNGARKYNDENAFNQNHIALRYTTFQAQVYPQLHGAFINGLSILDVLMNCSITTIQQFLKIGA